jgi:tetratricopeptide (TPR) repeat protein
VRAAAPASAWAAALLLALAPDAAADRVLTRDGRVLSPQKARERGGGYHLVFEHGEITLPDKSLVASVEIEGDMSEYVPQNEDERKKLEQGYVKYRGRWLSAPAYQDELKKQHEASRKRTEELALHSDWYNAWEKETKHFIVRSNTSPELLDHYCELMEAYWELMDQRIGINPTPSLKRMKMRVNIFKSHAEFVKIAEARSMSVLGFFSPMDKSLNFFHDYAEPARSEWVALHECTHLLTFLIDPQYIPQIWLNEAVADYFGSSRIVRDKKGKLRIEPGELQMDRTLTVQQAIKDVEQGTVDGDEHRPFTKLEDLLVLTRDKFDGFQYAHAWSFVYFLNTYQDGKYSKAFDRFFKGLYTLEKGIPFSSEAVGGAVPEMGGVGKLVAPADIREYLLKRLGVKDVDLLERQWKEHIAAIPIEGSVARLKRGLLAVSRMDYEDALPDLDAAIEAGTKDPRAFSARARARFAGKETDKAKADFQKAIELDPLRASYRYDLSRLMTGLYFVPTKDMEGVTLEIDVDEKGRLTDAEAKLQAGLAMELDPENPRLREWYEQFQ